MRDVASRTLGVSTQELGRRLRSVSSRGCLPNSYRQTSHRRRQPGRGADVPEGREVLRLALGREGHRTRVAINMAIISSRLRPVKATGSETPVTIVLFRRGAADPSHKQRGT